jgi:hypothetical protein
MKKWILLALGLGCAAGSLGAPSADSPNEGLAIAGDPAGSVFSIRWWGRAGRAYLIEHTDDLRLGSWGILPVVEAGYDEAIEYGFIVSGADRFFARLRSVPHAGGDPLLADFDGDGIPTWWEIENGLDPFSDDASGDADGDGISNYDEWLAGLDPQRPDANPLGLEVYTP